MKTRNRKGLVFFWIVCQVIAFSLLFSPTLPVRAQQPKTITAEGTITGDGYSIPFTMEFSPTGGPVIGTIDYSSEFSGVDNVSGAPYTDTVTMKLTMNGIFAGGDGGAANGDFLGEERIMGTRDCVDVGECDQTLPFKFGPVHNVYLKNPDWNGNFYANGTGSGVLHWYHIWLWYQGNSNEPIEATWKVTYSPEEFQAALGATVTKAVISTPGKGCSPSVGNLSGLKPGDTLSPSVEFSDPDGNPIAPLSVVWYINGQQTSSITWDGKETTLELQYTCPDHAAHTQNYTVAAYGVEQTPAGQEVTSTPTPVSAGTVISPPTPVSANDCLSDPLNAAGCMSTPFIRQGAAAVVSVAATLATILVIMLGSAATTAGGAVAGAVAGAATSAATGVATSGATGPAVGSTTSAPTSASTSTATSAPTSTATSGTTAGAPPNPILNIIQNNPQLNGGPNDNSSTNFDGGDGPGGCSPNGLPNYWVNTANLNLYIQDTVYTYRGLGPDIALKLSYNSAPGNAGMFGRNWRFSYDSVIQQLPDRCLLWKGSGQRLTFRSTPPLTGQNPNTPKEAVALDGSRDRLFDYRAYFLLFESESRLRYRYDKSPGAAWARLTAIVDQNENAVKFAYNPDEMLHSVTDAAGRVTSFVYDPNHRCVGFSLPDGRQAKYAYDGQGNFIQAVDLLGTTAVYEYNDKNSLVRMTVGRDQKTTAFTYQDNGQGQYLAGVTDAAGNNTRYELLSVTPRHVRVTDPEGQPSSYYSTPQGYTERVVDPLGNTVTTGFDNGRPVSFTNANHQTGRMEYDARGNMIRMIDPLGAVWASTYDNNDHLTSETGPFGAVWQYGYDARGNLVRTVSPGGRALSLEYDGQGQVVSMEDSGHNRVRFAYDAFGNVASRTDPIGNTAHMSYDSTGMHLIVHTDARGNATHYEYDANDRLTRVTYPDGTFRSFAYDCCAGVSEVDENGNQTNYRRDPILMLSEQKDAAGARTLFTYDRNHRPVEIVNALGHTAAFAYDAAGRRVHEVNPMGKMIQAQYDPNGNLVALVNQLGKANSFEYDAANRLVRTTDPLGQALIIQWDKLGRPSEIIGARGGKVGLSYNPDGDLVAKTYNGVRTATYEYDETGNLSRLEDPTGIHSFTYNPVGQVSAIRYPDGTQVAFSYDEARNLNSILYPGNLKVLYTYDQRNRVTKLDWQSQSVSYQYNAVGDVIRETRSNGVESTYTYDESGRTLELCHVLGGKPFVQVRYTRNAIGDITCETGRQPVSAQSAETGGDILYNDLDQIRSRGQEHYTYDADGNLTAISGDKWQAGYDLENRPQEVARDGQTVAYLYNGLGQRVQSATDAAVRNYHYDLKGCLLFETDGNGQVTCCYLYSGALLAARYTPDGQSFFYHFNHQGSTLAVTDTDGGVAAAYDYTPFGLLLAGQSGRLQNNPFTFIGAYGVMDEGGSLYYMKNRYYDANTGRFIQKDPLGTIVSINPYDYVGNNPLNRIDPLGLFDRGFLSPAEVKKAMGRGGDLTSFIRAASGPLTASSNIALGVGYTFLGVSGIMSGGSIPLATLALINGVPRTIGTILRTINGDYGAEYQPGDIPADVLDPTKGLRKTESWLGQKWDDFHDWGTNKTGQAIKLIYSCYRAPL